MGVQWFALFIFFLLASQIQYVSCADTNSSQDHSSPDLKDHCGNNTTDCTRASSGDKILSWMSSTVSCFIFLVPVKRVHGLQSSNQDVNAAQPLFRWSFFFGIQAYTLWTCYFVPFIQYPQCPGFPIFLTCLLGAITNAVLLVAVISKAPVVGLLDPRLVVGVLSVVVLGFGLNFHDKQQIIGWVAVAFGVLSHSCRIASTEYYANFNVFLFVASVVGTDFYGLCTLSCVFLSNTRITSLGSTPWSINMNSLVINVVIWTRTTLITRVFIELYQCGRNSNYAVLCIIGWVLYHWLSERAGGIVMVVSSCCSHAVEDGGENLCASARSAGI